MTDTTLPQTSPSLARPPIVEVVCGVVFDPVPNLDLLLLGVYWDERKADFPIRQIHPAFVDEPAFTIPAMPMKAFIMSLDRQFVLQIQHDRFFMNWRQVGGQYPRFSEARGSGGLLSRMEDELRRLGEFVRNRCGHTLTPKRVELTKVDILSRPQHWDNINELSALVPVTGVFERLHRSGTRDVNLRFVEQGSDGTVIVHVTTVMNRNELSAVRLDFRFVTEPSPTIHESFIRGNAVLNQAFFTIIPEAKRHFGSEGDGDGNRQAS